MNIKRDFDSWDAFVDAAIKGMDPAASAFEMSYGGWAGTVTWEEAIGLARDGWAGPRTFVNGLVREIEHRMEHTIETRFEPLWDVSGSTVDIGRYCSDIPECMIDVLPMPVSTVGKVLGILVNIDAAGGVDAESIKRRGAAIVALIELLALLNHETEVWIEFGSKSRNYSSYSILVTIKRAGEKLDLDKLMFAIANPATLRRLGFAVQEGEPSSIRKTFNFGGQYGSSYGSPIRLSRGTEDGINPDIKLDLMEWGEDWNEEKATDWVKSNLAKFGLSI